VGLPDLARRDNRTIPPAVPPAAPKTPADAARDGITAAVERRVTEVQDYVPGYALRADPQYDDPREQWGGNGRVAVFLEVKGAGDYLPEYAGNLDIMTAAALRTGEVWAERALGHDGHGGRTAS